MNDQISPAWICQTCGVQFPPSPQPPGACPVCQDERQYIGLNGQQWTTLAALQADRHNLIRTLEPNLSGIGTVPAFAIGQRALLVQTPEGNVLWDCISLIDETTIRLVTALGGIAAVAVSHPHFYASVVEWSRAFNAPVYLHAADRQWVRRPDPSMISWEGETQPLPGGLTLVRCGGHFPGGTVLHWPGGAEGRGALLSADILTVAQDRRHVSFMYSYPNLVPLPPWAVRRVVGAVASFDFDRIYGGWWDKVIQTGAKEAVRRSAERYIAAITRAEQ